MSHMKRAIILTLTALTLASCKPQKPWSPYDKDGGTATPESGPGFLVAR